MTVNQKKKVHVGCGTVYLEGYINVDIKIIGISFLAKDRPDLVKTNLTTPDKYYKKLVKRSDIEKGKLHEKKIVVDIFADVRKLPFSKNSLDEIRSVQVFEHFTYKEGVKLLQHWHNLLKPGGLLHIDVPDLDETLKLYLSAKSQKEKNWYLRLLYGNQKNEYSLHKAMYSPKMLKSLLLQQNFHQIKNLGNIHFYPAFAMEAGKK